MNNPYAANKAILHVERLMMIRNGAQAPPVHLHFIISDLCNQDCGFCAYRMDGYTTMFADGQNHNPHRMIPTGKALALLNDARELGVRAVQFTGGGEPTVHPDCDKIMAHARAVGMETALVTNGVRLHLVPDAVRCTWVRVSIDCGTSKTYAATRRVPESTMTKVCGNVAGLVKERNARRLPCVIGIGYVVTKHNYHEILQGVRLARSLGVDNVRLSAVFQPDDDTYFESFFDDAVAACAEAVTLSTDRFRVINNFGSRHADMVQKHPDYRRCPHQHLVTYIGADLNLYRCCVLSYQERGLLGNLADRSFGAVWNSAQKRDDFAGFDARGCPRCQFNDKNRSWNQMIDNLPTIHGNFV